MLPTCGRVHHRGISGARAGTHAGALDSRAPVRPSGRGASQCFAEERRFLKAAVLRDAQPKRLSRFLARYPPLAQMRNIQGVVVLEATVQSDGHVLDCRVLRPIPYLAQAALDAVARGSSTPNPSSVTAHHASPPSRS